MEDDSCDGGVTIVGNDCGDEKEVRSQGEVPGIEGEVDDGGNAEVEVD